MKGTKIVLDLVTEEVQRIFDEKFKNNTCKPTFFISMMYEKGYLLTLIHSNEKSAYDFRQSEFISLQTDLEETIEFLYNRTM